MSAVPYECAATTTRARACLSRIVWMAWVVDGRERGAEVMRELIERNSGTRMPMSGWCDARSARKPV